MEKIDYISLILRFKIQIAIIAVLIIFALLVNIKTYYSFQRKLTVNLIIVVMVISLSLIIYLNYNKTRKVVSLGSEDPNIVLSTYNKMKNELDCHEISKYLKKENDEHARFCLALMLCEKCPDYNFDTLKIKPIKRIGFFGENKFSYLVNYSDLEFPVNISELAKYIKNKKQLLSNSYDKQGN